MDVRIPRFSVGLYSLEAIKQHDSTVKQLNETTAIIYVYISFISFSLFHCLFLLLRLLIRKLRENSFTTLFNKLRTT